MEDSLNDPLKEHIELIQNSGVFIEIQAEVTAEAIDMNRLSENLRGGGRLGLYIAVICISGLKDQIVAYHNVESYLVCLSNLIDFSLISERLIESELLLLLNKMYHLLFDYNNCAGDVLQIYEYMELFFKKYQSIIMYTDRKINFIIALLDIKQNLDMFITRTKKFRKKKITIASYGNEVKIDLLIIKSYSNDVSFIGKDLRESVCNFMTNFIIENVHSQDDFNTLIRVIESNKEPVIFPIALGMASEIEKNIFSCIFQNKIHEKKIEYLATYRDKLIEKHNQTFENCKQRYESTEVRAYPSIEDLLCLALKNLLENCLSDWLNKVYDYLLKNYHQYAAISLTSIIKQIAKFPLEMQYALAEHLYRVGNVNDYKMVIFFVEKVNSSLQYQRIDKSWAEDFINIACSSPYKEYLLPYMKVDNTDLEAQLRLITDTIIRMQLPDGVSGVTFCNLTMCIRLFPESRGCKGASFIVYLHELAHYLQRASGRVIKECESLASWKNVQVPESGDKIERDLFGSRIYLVTDEAAEYLVTPPLSDSYEVFMQEFNRRNRLTETASLINFKRSGGPIYLGRCGSKFSSLNMKEESKS